MNNILIRIALVVSLWFTAHYAAIAQQPASPISPISVFRPDSAATDTLRGLRRLTHGGDFDLFSRIHSFSTVNSGDFADHSALGLGLGLGYTSPEFARVGQHFGLRFAVAGYFIFNVASTDLAHTDPLTAPAANRYEIGLFDVRNPGGRKDISRLENLNVTLRLGPASLCVGRMSLETPFLNGQDGRMRPTMESAAWLRLKLAKKLNFEGGWINSISPRSTVSWWHVGETMGIYPVGVGPDGRRSTYAGNVQTAGLAIANLRWKPGKRFDIQGYHYWLENVFHLSWAQAEYTQPLGTTQKLMLGLQGAYQQRTEEGGNPNPELAYMIGTQRAWVGSARLRYQLKKHSLTLNATRIGDEGRFLFPREWGRDPFYTFMSRERNEGLANVWAATTQLATRIAQDRMGLSAGYGRYWLPSVRDFARNKYGIPSYDQFNFLASYTMGGWAKGLEFRLLYVYKGKQGDSYGDARYVYQKVDMHLLNLIIDYRL